MTAGAKAVVASSGEITKVTSTGGTVNITNATGPTVNLEVASGEDGINQLTGDVTAGPGVGSQAATLATVATAQTTGDASHTPTITIDAKGRVTTLVNNLISIVSAQVSDLATTLAGYLAKTGGTMTGAIAMGANKITGVANGSAAQDVAAFGQIPSVAGLLGLTQLNAATSGTFTAAIGDIIETSGASTITLPASPAIGNCVFVARGNHSALVTISANTGQTINGQSSVSINASTTTNPYVGQALFIAQSATEWNAVALGTDLGQSFIFGGGLYVNQNSQTANYSTVLSDIWVRCSTNSFTVTLTNSNNKMIIVTSETAGQTITVAASSGAINGPTSLVGVCGAMYLCVGTGFRCVAVWGMSNTAGSATASTPTFANGIAAQLAQTYQDAEIYFQIGTAGTAFALAIGPTSGVANTVMTGATVASGQQIRVRLPAGWYLKWSATTATLSVQLAVTC